MGRPRWQEPDLVECAEGVVRADFGDADKLDNLCRAYLACVDEIAASQARTREAAQRLRELTSAPNQGPKSLLDHVADVEAEFADFRAREQALRDEVDRLRASGCPDCGSTGHDGSNPCCSCHGIGSVEEAMLMTERDEARDEVERLRSILVRVQPYVPEDVLDALARDRRRLVTQDTPCRGCGETCCSQDEDAPAGSSWDTCGGCYDALAREDGGE